MNVLTETYNKLVSQSGPTEVVPANQSNTIKKWLSSHSYLNARTDDKWISAFVQGCNGNVEEAEQKMEWFYTYKTLVPELYNNRDPFAPEMQELLNNGVFLMPKMNKANGERIFFIRLGHFEPTKSTFAAAVKLFFMLTDVLMFENDKIVNNGLRVIQDFKDITMGHVSGIQTKFVHEAMNALQTGYPLQFKGFQFFNVSSVSDLIIKMLGPFWNQNIKGTVHTYTNDKVIGCDGITKDMLPKEYGGTGGTIEELAAETKQKIEKYKDWFSTDSHYGTDESKRPGGSKTIEAILGMENIRKLNID